MANFGTFSNPRLQKRMRRFAAVTTSITPVSESFQSSLVESPSTFVPIELAVSVVEHSITLVSNKFSASGAKSYIPKSLHLPKNPIFLYDTTLLVDTVGNRLAIPVIHRLPSIIALDGVDTSFFSHNRDGNGKQTIRGTYQSPLPATAGMAGLNAIDMTNIEIEGLSGASSCSTTSLDEQVSTYPNLSMPWVNEADSASLQTINSASPEAAKALDTIQANSLIGVDLTPYAPLGWDAPLIVTTIPGSHVNGQAITTADTPFYYVCLINDGYYAVIDRFKYTFSIDGVTAYIWSENRAIYSGVSVQSVIQGPPLSEGTHQATLTVDSENTVQETNENNNIFNYVFTVLGTTPPPTLSINDLSINEGSDGVNIALFTVALSAVATSAVTVNYATTNGTGSSAAVAPNDYTSSSGSLTFTPGQTSKTISVTIIGDTVIEPNETFFVNLSGATNATIADNQGVGTILDDDSAPPVVTVVATDPNAAESLAGTTANPGSYTLTRSVVTANPLAVNISMSGEAINSSDYISIPATVTFAANSSTAIVDLTPIDDTLPEQPEVAILTIVPGTGYTIGTAASATVTIADNDSTVGTIAIAKTTDGRETGPVSSVFTLTRTGSAAAALDVSYTLSGAATLGLDYTGSSPGTATFAAGSAATTITLSTIDDDLVDPNETIIATITAPTGYTISGSTSATATIVDDDLGTIAIVKTTDGNETGPVASVFSLTRTGGIAAALDVSYTLAGAATLGLDYTGSSPGTATFAAGSATTTITLPTINDVLVDPNETIIATITAPTGFTISGSASATATINDNDGSRQIVTPDFDSTTPGDQTTKGFRPNSPLGFNVNYSTSNGVNALFGIGFRLHFDSRELTFGNLSNLFGGSIGGDLEPDTNNFDNDPNTDTFIKVGWFDPQGKWPNQPLPLRLYTANFTTNDNFDGTEIKLSSDDTAVNYGFQSTPALIKEGPIVNLDIDNNGLAKFPSDAQLIVRYLFELSGDPLIGGVVEPAGTRKSAAEIEAYLKQGMPDGVAPFDEMLDPDGNGRAKFASDAQLIVRYLFGLRGEPLIAGVVEPDGTRKTAAQIEEFLNSYMPTTALRLTADAQTENGITNTTGLFQVISPSPVSYSVSSGASLGINVDYSTSNGINALFGIGFRLHFDSRELTFGNLSNLYGGSIGGNLQPDTNNFDNDPNTDTFIKVGWFDPQGKWPNQSLPLRLYTANFTTKDNFVGTEIKFSSDDTAVYYGFQSTSALINIATNGTIAIVKTTDGNETGPVASVFSLTRTGVTAAALDVSYTLAGDATLGLDYTGSSPGTATFAAGSATTTITLTTIDDVLVDSNETIIATINAPTGYTISGSASDTASIVDNDLGTIAIVKTTDGNETGPVASVFSLTRTGVTAAALDVSYTLAGDATLGLDYTGSSPGTATFAAGSATTTITLTTIDDVLVEPNETIIATITAPTGYTISGSASDTATIVDNDLGSIDIVKTTDGNETGPVASVFSLTRTGGTTAALDVIYTLAGAATLGLDYIGSSPGTATFATGSATTSITLSTIDDVLVDPNETIIATITAPSGYTISGSASAASTIVDRLIEIDFSLIKTIGNVAFGTSQLNYAIKRGDAAPIQVIFQGRTTSANYPGAGWSAIAAAASATGYDLYFKNTNGSYAAWNLDSNCVYTSGKLLSTIELLQAETNLNTDFDGDGANGLTFAPTRTIGDVALGNWQQGYALKVGSGNPIVITYAGLNASANSPGAGWSAIAAAASATDYGLFFKNTNGGYALWVLNGSGEFTAGKLLSTIELLKAESILNADIDGDGTNGLTFASTRTIGTVALGNWQQGYALKVSSGNPIPITYAGINASGSSPGAGWSAIAAAASATGYDLYFKNSNGSYAAWNLDSNGVYTAGRFLPIVELLKAEMSLNTDFDGDGTNGLMFAPTRTIGTVALGNWQQGYALKVGSGNPIPITYAGINASANSPGAGWSAIAAAASATGYDLYFKNTNGSYALWNLDSNGVYTAGKLLSSIELLQAETNLNTDFDGDGNNGLTFAPTRTIGTVALGNWQQGYALKVGSGNPIVITYAGLNASATSPGAGWSAIAAAASATGYDLYFKNTNGSYAEWNLDSNGSYTAGKLLSIIELLKAETNLNTDFDGDGTNGLTFAPTRTIGSVALGNWQQGYALKVGSGNPIPITYAGLNVSASSPGAGWSAIAAAVSATGYDLYFKNSNGSYAEWNLDSNGIYTSGKFLSTVEVVAEEVSIQADLTGDGQIGPFKLLGGGPLGDALTGLSNSVTFGFGAEDTLTGGSATINGFDILIGGSGNDSYNLPSGRSSLIADLGGDAADSLSSTALSLNGANTKFGTLEGGRHLVISDSFTNSRAYIYDWQSNSNKIEFFQLADGTFNFQQLQQKVTSLGATVIDLNWASWDTQFGKSQLTNAGFASGAMVDKLFSFYNVVSSSGSVM